MSKSDIWFFSFISLWIVLTAGSPDLMDAIICRVGFDNPEACMKVVKP